MTKELDDKVEDLLKEESAQTQAVKSLIEVKDRAINKLGTDIELKTDLDEKQVCVHTAADMLNTFLNPKLFGRGDILGDLVQIKERKLLSKDRKSRTEIVEVARTPDMNTFNAPVEGGFVKRLFSSRKNRPMG